MPNKTTYYAIVDDYSTREAPAGVLRRVQDDQGQNDEQFGHDPKWTHSPLLYAWERGDGDNQLHEISENEANQIIAQIRKTVTGEP
ncbi:MAG: hypothetical protein J2P25_05290 [Nocardiopsaceae bacterium]|nr:hypothetical protein [Nocardiopsaceae bacterium]